MSRATIVFDSTSIFHRNMICLELPYNSFEALFSLCFSRSLLQWSDGVSQFSCWMLLPRTHVLSSVSTNGKFANIISFLLNVCCHCLSEAKRLLQDKHRSQKLQGARWGAWTTYKETDNGWPKETLLGNLKVLPKLEEVLKAISKEKND